MTLSVSIVLQSVPLIELVVACIAVSGSPGQPEHKYQYSPASA